MNEEAKLPEGLELADELLEESGHVSEAVDVARDAIRAEHAQRMTLQHHAADLAQRVADLEKESDEWRQLASAYSPAKELAEALKQAKASGDAARMERDELRARLAELDRQEPVATAWITGGRMVNAFNHPPRSDFDPDERWAEIGYSQAPLYARPVPAVPEGWKLVKVKAAEFDSLMYWLERCESRGHMERCSDLIEPWGAFEYAEVAAPEHKA